MPRALVSHAGVFDLRSMFGETEELWFPLWEFNGAPWDNPESYAAWSPSYFAKEFRNHWANLEKVLRDGPSSEKQGVDGLL